MNNEHQSNPTAEPQLRREALRHSILKVIDWIGKLDYKIRLPLLTILLFNLLLRLVILWNQTTASDDELETLLQMRAEETLVPLSEGSTLLFEQNTGRIIVVLQDTETGIRHTLYLDTPFEGDFYRQWGPFLDIHDEDSGEGRVYIFNHPTQSLELVVSYDSHYSNPLIQGYENPNQVLVMNPFLYQFSEAQIEDAHPRFFMVVEGEIREFAVPQQALTLQNPTERNLFVQGRNRDDGVQVFRVNPEEHILEAVSPSFDQVEDYTTLLTDNDQEMAFYFVQGNQPQVLKRYDIATQLTQLIPLVAPVYDYDIEDNVFRYIAEDGQVLYSVNRNP
jgi:hypothetical protein